MRRTEGMVSPRQLIREGMVQLGGGPSERHICEGILSELLGITRTAFYLEEQKIPQETVQLFFHLVEGIKGGDPLQYLLKKATFMDDPYEVVPGCFIPRPATEILVEACLDYFNEQRPSLLIDMGTGSGCIAISLTKRIPCSKMLGIDISFQALQVAQKNGMHHGVSEKISWICGDLFHPLQGKIKSDAILSNPPYIPREKMETLSREVQREPRESLDGGEEGLFYYRRIVREGPSFLKKEGFLFLEIGDGQKDPVLKIFSQGGLFELLEIRHDVSELPRVMVFKYHG